MIRDKVKCWICGNEANSGEHKIKKSDLIQVFKEVTQKNPLDSTKNGKLQKNIGSLNSKKLKYYSICAKCNNERSQEFDKSWEKLSAYLYENNKQILKNNQINILDIFPNNTREEMKNIQLYFSKIFGCEIKEHNVPIDLSKFSESILHKIEHPYIYYSFRDSHIDVPTDYCAISNIQISKTNDTLIYAHMYYTVGAITVDLIYCENKELIDLNGAIKPSQLEDNTLILSNLKYKSTLPSYIQANMK